MTIYSVIGLMSGTSLDGIDLLHCTITAGSTFSAELHTAKTYAYSSAWREKLAHAHSLPLDKAEALDVDYTALLAEYINRFIKEYSVLGIDFIASHGHTVLHQPENGITYQIGNLPELASLTKHKVICNFRKQDVALGGQGAPLVPIGDQMLFGEYEACVNLGGFANISFEEDGKRLAYDICPLNKVLNPYAALLGKEFDEDGSIARASVVNPKLLSKLNKLQYYSSPGPKSLGIEWLEAQFLPLLKLAGSSSEEIIATCTEHFALQIAKAISGFKTVLFTGGGTYNTYLMELIAQNTKANLVVPEPKLIDYKEALIFALLGVLKERGEPNVFAMVTGAKTDHCAGHVFLPFDQ